MYYVFDEQFENNFNKLRGTFLRLVMEKKDGTDRELVGTLIRSNKGQFLIDEGIVGESDFKAINVHKIKQITIASKVYRPKGEIK